MRRAVVGMVLLLACAPVARADEATWDPSKDEGVPQDQLFQAADRGETPVGAKVVRKPVSAAAEEEPAAEAPPPEALEIVKPKRKKKRAPVAEEAVEEPAPAPRRARQGGREGGREGQYLSRRIQVFLVPLGEAASLAAGPTQVALEGEVGKLPGFKPVDLVEELAAAPSEEDQAKVNEARRAVGDGNKQMASAQYEEAANRYRRAVRLLEAAGYALEPADYAEAVARLAQALQLAGEEEASREAWALAARVDQKGVLEGVGLDKRAQRNLAQARQDLAQAGTGVLSVVTSPPGARVFLGGVFKGTTPITVDQAPPGMNLLRIDRPGAFPVVQFVEVKEGFDVPVKVKMHFTPEAQELQRTLTQVPRSLGREAHVPDMVKSLGTRFRLERAVIATVEMEKTNVAGVRLAVFDFPRDSRLADEKASFVVDQEGGLEAAVGKWARTVFDKAEGSRNRSASDPLDRSDGTEDWYGGAPPKKKNARVEDDANKPEWERSNYKPATTHKASVKSKDPLDHADGTEDW